MAWYQCPACGESVDTDPDRGAGEEMEYVEDCPVCCRPNVITARYDPDLDDYVVSASRE
ncbi:MAG TPA: CPXCG motif-containing cysteine-rich protein [Polyangia bacterium]|nr:CPXCG motif-containing cysteine-rich protein [Polyangia bacterium]